MADSTSGIFRERAATKLRSPDDLDKYLRVTNPGIWVVLVASLALLAGLFAWGAFGTVASSVETMGVQLAGEPVCFISSEDAMKIAVGDPATFDGEPATVVSVSDAPLSRDEVSKLLNNDYLTSTLVKSDWSVVVTFKVNGEVSESTPSPVLITTERITPLNLVFGRQ